MEFVGGQTRKNYPIEIDLYQKERNMTIDFEKDQEQVIDKTGNINKLADKIREMQAVQSAIEQDEKQIKDKKHLEHLSEKLYLQCYRRWVYLF